MKRFCLTLELREDAALMEEYRYHHRPENIWPEIPDGIRQTGITRMEIYELGAKLFMIVETPDDFDWDTRMKQLATLPRQAEWEEFMSKFQKARPGEASGDKWKMMDRIFCLNP